MLLNDIEVTTEHSKIIIIIIIDAKEILRHNSLIPRLLSLALLDVWQITEIKPSKMNFILRKAPDFL